MKNDAEPFSGIGDTFNKPHTGDYFSALDLASGCWHIPIHQDGTVILTFATISGLYDRYGLPFGIKVCPQVFKNTHKRVLNKN